MTSESSIVFAREKPVFNASKYSKMAVDENLTWNKILLRIRKELEEIYPDSYVYIAYNKSWENPLILLPGFVEPDNWEDRHSDPYGWLKLSGQGGTYRYDYVAIKEGTILYTGEREDNGAFCSRSPGGYRMMGSKGFYTNYRPKDASLLYSNSSIPDHIPRYWQPILYDDLNPDDLLPAIVRDLQDSNPLCHVVATKDRNKAFFRDGKKFDVIKSAHISSGKYSAFIFTEGTVSCSLKDSKDKTAFASGESTRSSTSINSGRQFLYFLRKDGKSPQSQAFFVEKYDSHDTDSKESIEQAAQDVAIDYPTCTVMCYRVHPHEVVTQTTDSSLIFKSTFNGPEHSMTEVVALDTSEDAKLTFGRDMATDRWSKMIPGPGVFYWLSDSNRTVHLSRSCRWTTRNWMSQLKNQTTLLSRITIPGTHYSQSKFDDTVSVNIMKDHHSSRPPFIHTIGRAIQTWNRTQDSDVIQQLNGGIRFLDLRTGPSWTLRHGDTTVFGDDVRLEQLDEIANWLSENNGETVLISIQWGSSQAVPPPTFASDCLEMIQNHGSWWLDPIIPTIEQARGKMVLIRRQEPSSLFNGGLYLDSNFGPGQEGRMSWYTQDYQDLSAIPVHSNYPQDTGVKAKLWHIKDTIEAARIPDREDRFFLNFTSGHTPSDESPAGVADAVNAEVMEYVSAMRNTCLGTIVMDFPNNLDPVSAKKSEEPMFVLARALIATNEFHVLN